MQPDTCKYLESMDSSGYKSLNKRRSLKKMVFDPKMIPEAPSSKSTLNSGLS